MQDMRRTQVEKAIRDIDSSLKQIRYVIQCYVIVSMCFSLNIGF